MAKPISFHSKIGEKNKRRRLHKAYTYHTRSGRKYGQGLNKERENVHKI